MAKKTSPQEEKPLHELLPPCNLAGGGGSNEQNQSNLIFAKQSPAFPIAGGLIAHCLTKRGEKILLDFSQQACNVRFQVDSVWHNVEPRDRETADAMLAVFKKLANLNPADRRSRQVGNFGADFKGKKYNVNITSQGVPTGERTLFVLTDKKNKLDRLENMGMRETMVKQFKEYINGDAGLLLISAPPENGLTTLWRSALGAADRFVRDYVGIEDEDKPEEETINVNPALYSSKRGESPVTILPKIMLKQPDSFVVPDFVNGESLKAFCDIIIHQKKPVIGRIQAKDCAEALLKLLAFKAPVELVSKTLKLVVNHRICRRLCDKCKQAYPPPPQLLQKLGIPPGRVQSLFREWQPPPPEQCVDAKGRPIEIPICQQCEGIGFFGRVGIFEMWIMDDHLQRALVTQPTVDNLRKAAKAGGNRTLQEEGVLLVAQGLTSINELQRVMKL